MDIFNQFWVPRKIYKPCGMFTEGHMILLLISGCVLTFLLIISIKITVEKIDILTKVFAVSLTFLEGIKIFFNFSRKNSCKIGFDVLYLDSIGGGNLEKRNHIHRKTGRWAD